MVTVERLYEVCDAIDNAVKEDLSDYFIVILSAIKASAKEKRFASQLIVRYFHKFPNLQEQAIDAIFELCEDDDMSIRKTVVKELPTLCKLPGSHVQKIADVLVQLLQCEDAQENATVQAALMHVLKTHPKDTLGTIFGHVLNAEEDLLRERAVRFLSERLPTLSEDVITKELEDYIVEECKKALPDASGEEFICIMHLLSNQSQLQSVVGRKMLLDMVIDQADLDKPFDAKDSDRVDQVIQCVRQAIPFFSKNVHSTPFLSFLMDKVLPVLDDVNTTGGEVSRTELLRGIADLITFAGPSVENVEKRMLLLFTRLQTLLPAPPSEDESEAKRDLETEPQLAFTDLECLFFTLHRMGRIAPEFFTAESRAEEMKEFRKRLQYVARMIQVYSNKLSAILKDKPKSELFNDENKLKTLAALTTRNITSIIKDLLHTPPIFRADITCSWRASQKQEVEAKKPIKRPSTDSARNGASEEKISKHGERQIYQPPSGKYSQKISGGFIDDGDSNFYDETTTKPSGRGSGYFYGNNRRGNRGRGNWRGRGRGGGRGRRWQY